jgi:hypothetical protein
VNTETLAQTSTQSSGYGSVAQGSTQSGRVGTSQARALNTYFGQ